MTLVFRYDTHYTDVYAGTLLLRTPTSEKPLCRFFINSECAPAPGVISAGFKSSDAYSLCLFIRLRRSPVFVTPLITGDWFQELAWMQIRVRRLDDTPIDSSSYSTLMQRLYLHAITEGKNPHSFDSLVENSSTLQEVSESLFHIEQSDITDDDDDFDDFDDW